MDINSPITYKWPYDQYVQAERIVNPLIAAMIEGDSKKLEALFKMGATIDGADWSTFKAALYHCLNNYPLIKCLVNNGLVSDPSKHFDRFESLDNKGYECPLLYRAWMLNNYDVMELLLANGFKETRYIWMRGLTELERVDSDLTVKVQERNDVRAIALLKKYGIPLKTYISPEEQQREDEQRRMIQENEDKTSTAIGVIVVIILGLLVFNFISKLFHEIFWFL